MSGSMTIPDSEKLDRILKAYVMEVQLWAGEEFRYAMARSSMSGEKSEGDSAELIFIMRKRPRDFAVLSNRIIKLTARYSRRYKIALQPVFRREEEERSTFTGNDCSCSFSGGCVPFS